LVDEMKTVLDAIADLQKRVRKLETKKSKGVEISTPETDEEMFSAPDRAGIESLTKPYHYRGQVFGVGDHVESVKRNIAKQEARLREAGVT